MGTTMLEGGSEEEEDCLAAFDFFLFWELDTTGVYPSVSMGVLVVRVGSETGVSLSAEICGAATGEKEEARRSVTVLPALVAGDLEEEEERLFDCFGVECLGHVRESWPTSLHRGQALSDPGQDAITLKPRISKKGVADN